MTTISLKIPDDLAARLDALAKARHTSRSALFREALQEKVKSADLEVKPSLFEQSVDLCGIGSSRMNDLGSNPAHLEGFGA
ncbi:MAG: ribbon-helix-helix domain-containing protein [Luteolibacter sp.]